MKLKVLLLLIITSVSSGSFSGNLSAALIAPQTDEALTSLSENLNSLKKSLESVQKTSTDLNNHLATLAKKLRELNPEEAPKSTWKKTLLKTLGGITAISLLVGVGGGIYYIQNPKAGAVSFYQKTEIFPYPYQAPGLFQQEILNQTLPKAICFPEFKPNSSYPIQQGFSPWIPQPSKINWSKAKSKKSKEKKIKHAYTSNANKHLETDAQPIISEISSASPTAATSQNTEFQIVPNNSSAQSLPKTEESSSQITSPSQADSQIPTNINTADQNPPSEQKESSKKIKMPQGKIWNTAEKKAQKDADLLLLKQKKVSIDQRIMELEKIEKIIRAEFTTFYGFWPSADYSEIVKKIEHAIRFYKDTSSPAITIKTVDPIIRELDDIVKLYNKKPIKQGASK